MFNERANRPGAPLMAQGVYESTRIFLSLSLAVLQEVREILRYAVEWNTVREDIHTRVSAFESWRQVAEILLTACPEDTVGSEQRRYVIVDLLNAIIKKVSERN